MDFSLSAGQRALTEAATAFARRELNQDLAKREDAGEFPCEAWRARAGSGIPGLGIPGLPIPAELGGDSPSQSVLLRPPRSGPVAVLSRCTSDPTATTGRRDRGRRCA